MKKFLTVLALLLMINISANAQEVTVDGTGRDRDEAIANAERAAVEQVVGNFVDSQTLVENAMLKLDEIYMHSQGFVSGVKILSEEKNPNGLYKVSAKMNVESEPNSALIGQLETVMRLKIMRRRERMTNWRRRLSTTNF